MVPKKQFLSKLFEHFFLFTNYLKKKVKQIDRSDLIYNVSQDLKLKNIE